MNRWLFKHVWGHISWHLFLLDLAAQMSQDHILTFTGILFYPTQFLGHRLLPPSEGFHKKSWDVIKTSRSDTERTVGGQKVAVVCSWQVTSRLFNYIVSFISIHDLRQLDLQCIYLKFFGQLLITFWKYLILFDCRPCFYFKMLQTKVLGPSSAELTSYLLWGNLLTFNLITNFVFLHCVIPQSLSLLLV